MIPGVQGRSSVVCGLFLTHTTVPASSVANRTAGLRNQPLITADQPRTGFNTNGGLLRRLVADHPSLKPPEARSISEDQRRLAVQPRIQGAPFTTFSTFFERFPDG
jgi:hypothetical protein